MDDTLLFNLNSRGIANVSNCSLTNIFLNYNLENSSITILRKPEGICSKSSCDIGLVQKTGSVEDYLYPTIFYSEIILNKDKGAVWLYNTHLSVPMDANVTFDITC